ncbi:MAG: hypothetical protein ACO3X1_15195 [Burkholderiaceae bacterium]
MLCHLRSAALRVCCRLVALVVVAAVAAQALAVAPLKASAICNALLDLVILPQLLAQQMSNLKNWPDASKWLEIRPMEPVMNLCVLEDSLGLLAENRKGVPLMQAS